MEKSYKKIDRIYGSLIEVSGVTGVQFGESVEITGDKGEKREGKVIRIHRDKVTVQVYESTLGMSTINSTVRFKHDALQIPLTKDILGRVLDGLGRPRDEGGKIFSRDKSGINPQPINPVARQYPKDFIQTGISSIDGLITLIRGQKLPIFSGNGMSHNKLAAQIVRQAKIKGGKADDFAVVFAAVGVTHDDGDFFKKEFMHSDAMDRVVMFVNYADDPIAERINTPRTALTVAEYLAFEHEMEILVVMSDLTSYGEALREVSAAREEVPSRKGYPGYLYSDLASLYERAGMLKNQKGSITFLPMLTMPNDDIAHPIPDLTGFITEGQLV
ncbi:MAG TPA: V-type ATP synthase subunit B, partial [Eubacteriaceae bacterium]|nr:V-type ATP synthase subunit B [Eubacteriaceae bacterium]